jgi:hypothetical protein
MNKLPTWARILIAFALLAILYGASRILLYLDKLPG